MNGLHSDRTSYRQAARHKTAMDKLDTKGIDFMQSHVDGIVGVPLKPVIRRHRGVEWRGKPRYYTNPNTGKRMSRGPRALAVTKFREVVGFVTGPIRNAILGA